MRAGPKGAVTADPMDFIGWSGDTLRTATEWQRLLFREPPPRWQDVDEEAA